MQGAALVGDKDQRLDVVGVLSGHLDDSFIVLQLQLLGVARSVANNGTPAGDVVAELKTRNVVTVALPHSNSYDSALPGDAV